MKLTANYYIRVRDIAPLTSTQPERIIEICKIDNGMCMVTITIDGQIEFTYSNQKFEASELIEIANISTSAHLILNSYPLH